MGHAFRDPVFATIGQEEATDSHRATIASAIGFFTTISVAVLLPFWGSGIDLFGIRNILLVLAFFTVFVGVIGLYIFESK